MKIFLSWSGDLSLKVALAFRDWMPAVIQAVKPYVSSEDIDKGTRWSTDIAKELEASSYGILCITPTNVLAPWINFEAGALSKAIDKANVSPFLFGVKRFELQGPLLQFQSTIFEEDDVCRLVTSINRRLDNADKLDDLLLARSFKVWWPKLKEQLDTLPPEQNSSAGSEQSASEKQEAILEELLELARNQQKLLRSPETIIPIEYLESALHHSPQNTQSAELHDLLVSLEKLVDEVRESTPESLAATKVQEQLGRLHRLTHGDGTRKAFRRRSVNATPSRNDNDSF